MSKALLVQIRKNPEVKKEELESFAHFSKLKLEDFEILDCFEDDFKSFKDLTKYKYVFIGGASEASVLEPQKYTFVPNLISFTKKLIDKKIATFASCFGFQVAVLALGGKIIRDSKNFEMGTYPILLKDTAKNDPVYENIPNPFFAVSVHQEKTTETPPNTTQLAYTKDCIHSFKVNNAPFWAFQFHPELDRQTLTDRLNAYKEVYTNNAEHFDQVIRSLKDTPHANKLVANFTSSIS